MEQVHRQERRSNAGTWIASRFRLGSEGIRSRKLADSSDTVANASTERQKQG